MNDIDKNTIQIPLRQGIDKTVVLALIDEIKDQGWGEALSTDDLLLHITLANPRMKGKVVRFLKESNAVSSSSQWSMPVEGMTCASCALSLQKHLEKRKDVLSAEVNFATGKATIDFLVPDVSFDEVQSGVQSLGYALVPVKEEDREVKNEVLSKQRRELIWAGIFTFPVFILGMFLMHMPGSIGGFLLEVHLLFFILVGGFMFVLGRISGTNK